jgi:nickel transport protein
MFRLQALALLGAAVLLIPQPRARAHGIETDLERFNGLTDSLGYSRNGTGATDAGTNRLNGLLRSVASDESPGADGNGIAIQSRFSTGVPAADAAVRLLPSDGGEPIELGRTDAEGRFRFQLPSEAREDWEVQVDAGPGHRDYLELVPTSAPPAMGVAPGRALRRVRPDALASLPGSRLNGVAPWVLLGSLGSLGFGGLLWQRRRS